MLDMRPNCENCDRDLPADEPGALICTFECTWCASCNDRYFNNICPNCGGELRDRPIRPTPLLEKYPASTRRVLTRPVPTDAPTA